MLIKLKIKYHLKDNSVLELLHEFQANEMYFILNFIQGKKK